MEKYIIASIEIDKAHSLDKNTEMYDGKEYPSELLYALRMVDCLEAFEPNAPELLKLAARCQHSKRWEIPRNTYPMDKTGYLKWRKALYIYQSEEASKILQNFGYDHDFVDQFKVLIQKREINKNPDAQIIEDIACLVFIEYYLEEFSQKHQTEKLKSIIAKTWSKMSDKARKHALNIRIPEPLKLLMHGALNQ